MGGKILRVNFTLRAVWFRHFGHFFWGLTTYSRLSTLCYLAFKRAACGYFPIKVWDNCWGQVTIWKRCNINLPNHVLEVRVQCRHQSTKLPDGGDVKRLCHVHHMVANGSNQPDSTSRILSDFKLFSSLFLSCFWFLFLLLLVFVVFV